MSRSGSQSFIPSRQQYVSSVTTPDWYADTISSGAIVRWSPSSTLTVHGSSDSPWRGSAYARGCSGAAGEPLPFTTIVAEHFLQRILTILPRTFSSAIVYLA